MTLRNTAFSKNQRRREAEAEIKAKNEQERVPDTLSIQAVMDHLTNIETLSAKIATQDSAADAWDRLTDSRTAILNSYIAWRAEVAKLTRMIQEGVTFDDLYNPDDEVDPQCR